MKQTLHHEGFSETSIALAISKIKDMVITKTNNRSVLGIINDNIGHIDFYAYEAGGVENIGLQNLSNQVNHMPLSPLKWKYAIDEYRQNLINRCR